jgi:hypothetical protein
MNRKQAIQNVALLVGGTLSSSTLFALFNSCNPSASSSTSNPGGGLFSSDLQTLLDEITETILPRTSTPGAKDAKVGEFIQLMIHDCYPKKDQEMFLTGLDKFQKDCQAATQKSFLDLKQDEREKFLLSIEKDLFPKKEVAAAKISDDHTLGTAVKKDTRVAIDAVNKVPEAPKEEPNHYYRVLKELTLLGFFTSEPGATKALEYVKIPGKYIGTMPLKPGQRAWATS